MSGSNLSPIFQPKADNVFIAAIRLFIVGAFLSRASEILSGIKLKAITQFFIGSILSNGFIWLLFVLSSRIQFEYSLKIGSM